MTNSKKLRRNGWLSNSFVILTLALVGLALWQRQAIYDWVQLRNYDPPVSIAALANDDGMTTQAKHLFYINHPLIKPRGEFSKFCPSGTEQSVVLGCYKSVQKGIFLLNVSNSELAGIEQVTAAHEMLHAAYDRLSSKKKDDIDAMLTSYYKTGLIDQTTRDTIAAYTKSEPNDVVNEMHSIFGTQISKLPSGLESYYQQYFVNRSKVTGYYQKYEAAFTSRQAQIKVYDSQLNALKRQIDDGKAIAEKQQNTLQEQRSQLENERDINTTIYNSGVGSYNQAVRNYNSYAGKLKLQIANYNDLVGKRNDIALEEQQLVQAISAPPLAQ